MRVIHNKYRQPIPPAEEQIGNMSTPELHGLCHALTMKGQEGGLTEAQKVIMGMAINELNRRTGPLFTQQQ